MALNDDSDDSDIEIIAVVHGPRRAEDEAEPRRVLASTTASAAGKRSKNVGVFVISSFVPN